MEDGLYILGDFNMSKISWMPDPVGDDFSSSGSSGSDVCESNALLPHNVDSCLMGSGLSQVNGIRNFQDRILDLVFCNEPSDVIVRKSLSPMIKIEKFHEPIEIEFTVGRDEVVSYVPDEHEFNFRKAKYDELDDYLSRVAWDEIFTDSTDVDSTVDRFYDILLTGFKQFVSLKHKSSNSHPPWYIRNLLNLKNRLSRAHKKHRNTGEAVDYVRY